MVVIHKAIRWRHDFTWNETLARLNLSNSYRLKARVLQMETREVEAF